MVIARRPLLARGPYVAHGMVYGLNGYLYEAPTKCKVIVGLTIKLSIYEVHGYTRKRIKEWAEL